jgi:hypothetical protein
VAVYAEEHLFGTPRMEVVLHHEVQKLPAAFADLVDELREGDAARDQTLAGVAGLYDRAVLRSQLEYLYSHDGDWKVG